MDRESRDLYKMVVLATDGGHKPLTGSIKINVKVVDANDNMPEFENSTYHVKVYEDAEIGTPILRVRAVDKDADLNGKVVYGFSKHIQNAKNFPFTINEHTGTIFLNQHLDFESTPLHQ
uniref:Cadherin domain-containing protein n=1 Tax=Helobdella robusta TaxID=6412 RepID=T1G3Z1_HELRO